MEMNITADGEIFKIRLGTHGVMVIVVVNGHGNKNSNPGRD